MVDGIVSDMNAFPPDPPLPGEVGEPLPPTDPSECEHDTVIYHECLECDAPMQMTLRDRVCCWGFKCFWRALVAIPVIHMTVHAVSHWLGIPCPLPESIRFIP